MVLRASVFASRTVDLSHPVKRAMNTLKARPHIAVIGAGMAGLSGCVAAIQEARVNTIYSGCLIKITSRTAAQRAEPCFFGGADKNRARQYSTGERAKLLGISKRGNKTIWRLLVQCARSIWERGAKRGGARKGSSGRHARADYHIACESASANSMMVFPASSGETAMPLVLTSKATPF